MMPPLNSAATAFMRAPRAITYRLKPYTSASPSMSRESATRDTEPDSRPALSSTTNIPALSASTHFNVAL